MNRIPVTWERKVFELLREQNYRITKTRRAVIDAFLTQTELTIAELMQMLTRTLRGKVNVGSVYNNVNLLVKAGVITSSTFRKNQVVYELAHIFLLHFICNKCDQTIHYHLPAISPIIDRAKLHQSLNKIGWSLPLNFKLEVGATCKQCRC